MHFSSWRSLKPLTGRMDHLLWQSSQSRFIIVSLLNSLFSLKTCIFELNRRTHAKFVAALLRNRQLWFDWDLERGLFLSRQLGTAVVISKLLQRMTTDVGSKERFKAIFSKMKSEFYLYWRINWTCWPINVADGRVALKDGIEELRDVLYALEQKRHSTSLSQQEDIERSEKSSLELEDDVFETEEADINILSDLLTGKIFKGLFL